MIKDLPRFYQDNVTKNVTFKVDPAIYEVLYNLRHKEKINVGKWMRDLVTEDLVKRGLIKEKHGHRN